MSIGKKIKQFREMNELTQDELGIKIGVSGKTISSWEIDRTEPKMGMIEKLSTYFGCDKSDLIGNGETKNQEYYLNEDTKQRIKIGFRECANMVLMMV
jgi:repressor LexA